MRVEVGRTEVCPSCPGIGEGGGGMDRGVSLLHKCKLSDVINLHHI